MSERLFGGGLTSFNFSNEIFTSSLLFSKAFALVIFSPKPGNSLDGKR